MQTPHTTTACVPTSFPRHCLRPYGAAMATVRHSYQNAEGRHGACCVHAQNKRRPSTFCRVLSDAAALPLRCHGAPTALLAVVMRSPRRSTIFRTPLERGYSVTGVLGREIGVTSLTKSVLTIATCLTWPLMHLLAQPIRLHYKTLL